MTNRDNVTIILIISYLFFISNTNFELKSKDDGSVVALILARGGSRGIKLKNLATINNVTLLARSIQVIKQSQKFDRIWVSTDHYKIKQEALQNGAQVHLRSPNASTDSATSFLAVLDFLRFHPEIKILGLVQVTSPFLKPDFLVQAVNMMSSGKFNSVFSASRQFKLRWELISGQLEPANFNPMNRPRRQDWDGEFIENGMFYLAKTFYILKWKTLQPPRVGIVEIPLEESLEIDTPLDLELARFLSRNNGTF